MPLIVSAINVCCAAITGNVGKQAQAVCSEWCKLFENNLEPESIVCRGSQTESRIVLRLKGIVVQLEARYTSIRKRDFRGADFTPA